MPKLKPATTPMASNVLCVCGMVPNDKQEPDQVAKIPYVL